MVQHEDWLAAIPLAARGRGLPAPRVAALLRDVASQLLGQAGDIALTMVRASAAEIPAYGAIADKALQADVHAVSSAVVRCWLTVMATGQPMSEDLLLPLIEGARRRAAQGIDLQSMLHAYRISIRVMWNEITATPAWRGCGQRGVLAQVGTWILDFADQICTAVAAAYTEEYANGGREHRRSALLNGILASPGPEHLTAPEELNLPHRVVVARVAPELSLFQLEETGRALEKQAGAVLWTVRCGSVVATVPLSGEAGSDELRRRLARLILTTMIVAVGIGSRAESAADSRSSYLEAAAALQVGPRLGLGCPTVYDHQELAPVIALMSAPAQARRFVTAALEPLGALASRNWVLPTLEAYLARQGYLKEVAAALSVHLNTVKYRMRELRPYIQSHLSDGDRAATMLLALRVRHLLVPDTGPEAASLFAAPGWREHGPPSAVSHRQGGAAVGRHHSRKKNLLGLA